MTAPPVRYHVAMSLDGFIAPLDGSVDWLSGSSGGEGYETFIKTIGGIVMGRGTFETELSFGPWGYDHLPTLVMTNRPIPNQPQGVETIAGDPAPALAVLQTRVKSGDIWLCGGGVVAGQFLDQGLIDRIEVTTIPVVLGAGLGLFSGARALRRLRLVETRTTGSSLHSVYLPN